MESIVYLLCAATALLCTVLLLRSYHRSGVRLLLWCGVCFAILTLNNVILFVDMIIVPTVDLSLWRALSSATAAIALVAGLILDGE